MSKTFGGVGAGLIGVGSGTAGLFDGSINTAVVVGGLVFFVMAVVIGFMDIARVGRKQLSGRLPTHVTAIAKIRNSYTVRKGMRVDVSRVCELGFTEIGEDNHVSMDMLAQRLANSPDSLSMVERVEGDARHLAGYFILYPLTKDAASRILTGSIVNGAGITDRDLCRSFRKPAAIYVGMVFGKRSRYDRTAAVFMLFDAISTIVNRSRSVEYVFARPATGSGLRLLNHSGFTPLERRNSEVWAIDKDAIERMFGHTVPYAFNSRGSA